MAYVEGSILQTDVYWVFDAEDRLLYVGMSGQLQIRLLGHLQRSEWFARAARIETETFANRREAAERERQAIWDDKPLFNKRVRRPKPPLPPIVKRDLLASVTAITEASAL